MTDYHERDGDSGRWQNQRTGTGSRPAPEFTAGRVRADTWNRRTDWKRLARNPDSERDLDYEVRDWERFNVGDGSNQVMFLPGEEELLQDDAFVVVHEESLVDLDTRR